MKARGKREAERSASPLVRDKQSGPALKARNTHDISAFQAYLLVHITTRGDVPRVARHLPLAFIFRAFGALRLFVQDHRMLSTDQVATAPCTDPIQVRLRTLRQNYPKARVNEGRRRPEEFHQ